MTWTESTHWKTTVIPRIGPGGRRDIGIGASALSAAAARLIGARSVHAISTFAYNSRMFWGWLAFWVRMMALARLPRADGELIILRTAWNTGNRYEWTHHAVASRLGRLSVADPSVLTAKTCPKRARFRRQNGGSSRVVLPDNREFCVLDRFRYS